MESVPNLPGLTKWLQHLLHPSSSTEVGGRDAAPRCGPLFNVCHVLMGTECTFGLRMPRFNGACRCHRARANARGPFVFLNVARGSLLVSLCPSHRLNQHFRRLGERTLVATVRRRSCGPLATRGLVEGLIKINVERHFVCSFRSL